MEIILHIETAYEAVFLINGQFFERATLRVDGSEVVYITVLPLCAGLLSYTVKLIGQRAICGSEQCLCYQLSADSYYIRLLERHSYIYSTKKQQEPTVSNTIFRFFMLVKQKNCAEARTLLTKDLSQSIDNNSLIDFFEDYVDIIENKNYLPSPPSTYLLITKNHVAHAYTFERGGTKISNIMRC